MSRVAPSKPTPTISPLIGRITMIVGWVLLLVSGCVFGYMLFIAVTDPAQADVWMNESLQRTRGRERMAPNATGPIVFIAIMFFLGATCVGIADIARRHTSPASIAASSEFHNVESVRHGLRPISPWWQLLWLVLLLVAFVGILPVQFSVGLLSPAQADERTEMLIFLLLFGPGVLAAGGAAVVFVSLIKKLSFPAQERRRDARAAESRRVPQRGAVHTFLYLWRGDLWFAGFGGTLIGISAWPYFSDGVGIGHFLVFSGVCWLVLGVVAALQFWRTGENLNEAVIGRKGRS
ncbi:hypothetical protein D6T64_10440 [Cryobacterium melibiosiphilum]|uniref:Uncharacterized protein n=1 Tax=Cryobacterium melibiosiphilum TaxID=995039 RepID=A0A3A5MR98_9MICO|nr:hypothetical protein [Cryobacterium melibiosiphilum]RJT88536.1 hypothetical protein D6T64_10440 [Cryobacterium melibiosiphilum]